MTLTKLSDEWQTPQWLFDELNEEFKFDVDLCASTFNKKCACYFESGRSFLEKEIYGVTAFMNPPYSVPEIFMRKAWEQSKNAKIVSLVKVDPSTKWWGIFWDYDRQAPKPGCEIRYPYYKDKNQGRRIKFDPPSKDVLEIYLTTGSEKDKKLAKSLLTGKITTPAFASAIIIMDRR